MNRKQLLVSKRYISDLIIISAFLLAISGCASEKPSIIKRAYHNLTANYNGYFHAKVKYNAAVKSIEKAHIDNYDKLLSVFKLGDEKQAQSIFPDTDEAIKKTSTVIQRHNISKWVDECYFLIGRCHFYKRDYEEAGKNFQYVLSKFKPQPPKHKILRYLKQRPLRYESLIWLGKTHIQSGNTDAALAALDVTSSEAQSVTRKKFSEFFKKNKKAPNKEQEFKYKFRKKLKGELAATKAHYDITENNYNAAIDNLINAIKYSRKKHTKTRYMYILAQLYQQNNNGMEAIKYYKKVIKRNPPYDMEFHAKINIAESFGSGSLGSGKEIEKELKKMINDDKNREYLDQLFFSLANVALKRGDKEKAITNFLLSIQHNTINSNQKTLSFFSLANLYYDIPDYAVANQYYDSTANFMLPGHSDYGFVIDRKSSLSNLVKNINIISMEDSLQYLASLSAAERDYIIDNTIAKILEEKEKFKQTELEKVQLLQDIENNRQNDNKDEVISSWYFYNPPLITMGLSEFKVRWGTRQLENNWRRINKNSALINMDMDQISPDSADASKIISHEPSLNKQDYYTNIPLTKEKMEKSHERIKDALYACGNIYREQLNNYSYAISAFNELLRRYPDNDYKIECYYNLYLLYQKTDKQDSSVLYKKVLVHKFPESDYVKFLVDPDYLNKKNVEKSAVSRFYEETYKAYLTQNYQSASENSAIADSIFPENPLNPKFDYLNALCVGKTQPVDTFEAALLKVSMKYPDTEIGIKAKETMMYIRNFKNQLADTSSIDTVLIKKEKYLPESLAIHYYILVINVNAADLNGLKTTFSKYNSEFHSLESLKINTFIFNDTTQLIIIKEFENADKAKAYAGEIKNYKDIAGILPEERSEYFCITPANFNVLYKEKTIVDYLDFYKKHYID